MRLRAIFRSASVAILLPGMAGAQCLADGARYHMLGDPAPEIRLTRSTDDRGASELDLILTVPGQPASFRFQPVQSQGYGSIFAVPISVMADSQAADALQQDTLTSMPQLDAKDEGPFAAADFPLALFRANPDGKLIPYDAGATTEVELPTAASRAPDAIFMAQLGSNFWYGSIDSDNPVILPQEIWYLDCN